MCHANAPNAPQCITVWYWYSCLLYFDTHCIWHAKVQDKDIDMLSLLLAVVPCNIVDEAV